VLFAYPHDQIFHTEQDTAAMPLFAIYAHDKKNDGPAIRAAARPDHIKWALGLGTRLRMGGPLMSEDGEQMVGSLLLVEAESLRAMEAEAKTDPYAKAGLFERVEITPIKWLLTDGQPV
jgi:uncharacterized protein YciI